VRRVALLLALSTALCLTLITTHHEPVVTAAPPPVLVRLGPYISTPREQPVSRAHIRTALPKVKVARAKPKPKPITDPRAYARSRLSAAQFSCLDRLFYRESQWRVHEQTGSAYGIPQALPGHRMASAGPDWRTNGITQVRWGLAYIKERYGTPCAAWAHSESHHPHWY
jgi:hypothetical protein